MLQNEKSPHFAASQRIQLFYTKPISNICLETDSWSISQGYSQEDKND